MFTTAAFLKKLPQLFNLASPLSKMSFAGAGEDIVVLDYFINFEPEEIHNGFYVDFGAYCPIRWSNTFMLHLYGWRGMNIDAVQEHVEKQRIV